MYDLFLTHRVNRRREKRKKKRAAEPFFQRGLQMPPYNILFFIHMAEWYRLARQPICTGPIRSRVR